MNSDDGAAGRQASRAGSHGRGIPSPAAPGDADSFVPIAPLRPPAGSPGMRMVSLDGVGFGSSTVCCAPSASALLARGGGPTQGARRVTERWSTPGAARPDETRPMAME